MSKKFKIACVIGLTGSGKSSTANSISGQQKFKESCGTASETDLVNGLLSTWQGVKGEEPVIVLDTPGLGDSKGRDTEIIA
jgi:predicted GTPase